MYHIYLKRFVFVTNHVLAGNSFATNWMSQTVISVFFKPKSLRATDEYSYPSKSGSFENSPTSVQNEILIEQNECSSDGNSIER